MCIISWSYMIFRKKSEIWAAGGSRVQIKPKQKAASNTTMFCTWASEEKILVFGTEWCTSTTQFWIGSTECAATWRRWKSQGHLSSKPRCCAGPQQGWPRGETQAPCPQPPREMGGPLQSGAAMWSDNCAGPVDRRRVPPPSQAGPLKTAPPTALPFPCRGPTGTAEPQDGRGWCSRAPMCKAPINTITWARNELQPSSHWGCEFYQIQQLVWP